VTKIRVGKYCKHYDITRRPVVFFTSFRDTKKSAVNFYRLYF